MEVKTELVAVNLICDKKNRFFNIVGKTEEEIRTIELQFDKKKWIIIRR